MTSSANLNRAAACPWLVPATAVKLLAGAIQHRQRASRCVAELPIIATIRALRLNGDSNVDTEHFDSSLQFHSCYANITKHAN